MWSRSGPAPGRPRLPLRARRMVVRDREDDRGALAEADAARRGSDAGSRGAGPRPRTVCLTGGGDERDASKLAVRTQRWSHAPPIKDDGGSPWRRHVVAVKAARG